ncbi:hypothetical protein [Clostridium grantii]|uniref:Uncharacterized protein n=1 Tax=Clostridium grantii DSM 8605 TaxID=1121316 RepID=A0A1M5TPF7_9CLOT|nr:hypothetical protein [Clostridium grantii]SHH52647.1 hypothetical protein SAMN02745207_01422 [Clostridium grantii DSM 8605]
MRHEVQKISKIVDEIINFCFLNSSKKVNISIENTDDAFIIITESDQINHSTKKIDQIKELLNVQRQTEMEEYYWQLAGEDIKGGELNLVGMMVDEVDIEFKPPSLKIKLVRYKK